MGDTTSIGWSKKESELKKINVIDRHHLSDRHNPSIYKRSVLNDG